MLSSRLVLRSKGVIQDRLIGSRWLCNLCKACSVCKVVPLCQIRLLHNNTLRKERGALVFSHPPRSVLLRIPVWLFRLNTILCLRYPVIQKARYSQSVYYMETGERRMDSVQTDVGFNFIKVVDQEAAFLWNLSWILFACHFCVEL